jgi:hypothetical protein
MTIFEALCCDNQKVQDYIYHQVRNYVQATAKIAQTAK